MAEKHVVEQDVGVGVIGSEIGGEYTLPDYMPEVRRVLRVDSVVALNGQYMNGEKCTISGDCRYYLLYTGEDGKIASAPLDENFECTFAAADGAQVQSPIHVDSSCCRPSGPRRVNLKTNLSLHPRCFVSKEWTEIELPESAGERAVLRKKMHVGKTMLLHSEGIPMSATVKAEPSSTILSCDGRVLLREVRCENGGARLRGEIWLTALCNNALGEPYSVKAKIPVEEYIPCDGVAPECLGVAWGSCRNLTATPSEGENGANLIFDLLLDLDGTVVCNEEISLMCDIYALKYPLHVGYHALEGRYYPIAQMGNFTVDGSVGREELGCEDIARVVDCRGEAVMESCVALGSEISVEGFVRMHCILVCGERGEYIGAHFQIPFKVRMNTNTMIPDGGTLVANVFCAGTHTHSDGLRLLVDAELAIHVLVKAKDTLEIVAEAEIDADMVQENTAGEIVAAYLQNGDSLWSVGKRYRVTPESLMRENSLPAEIMEEPDAPHLLDGLSRLMLQRD